jgi:hypothetical protein
MRGPFLALVVLVGCGGLPAAEESCAVAGLSVELAESPPGCGVVRERVLAARVALSAFGLDAPELLATEARVWPDRCIKETAKTCTAGQFDHYADRIHLGATMESLVHEALHRQEWLESGAVNLTHAGWAESGWLDLAEEYRRNIAVAEGYEI